MSDALIHPDELDQDWPQSQQAPCRADGQVREIDYDAKEAACFCPIRNCLVDKANRVIGLGIDLLGRTGREAYRVPPSN
jgi:hypothetical protein